MCVSGKMCNANINPTLFKNNMLIKSSLFQFHQRPGSMEFCTCSNAQDNYNEIMCI